MMSQISSPFSEMPNRELFALDPENIPDEAVEEIEKRILKACEAYRESWDNYQLTKVQAPKKSKKKEESENDTGSILGRKVK